MTHEFTKTVAFKAVDEENRTATGAVLVPNEVDRQQDFLRPAGVESMFAEDPDDGVMHAAFPDGAAELVRNEIVDEPIELNGEEYPAGTWVATRRYVDDDLWQLVEDGVLTGFSIGGEVDRVREYAAADVPDDVAFPDDVPAGPATEIVEGSVNEVSDVDIPAVPRATYRELSKLGKSITEEVSGEEEFVEVMRERGHDEADARELWAYLQTHKAVDERAESRAGQDNTKMPDDTDDDGAEPESSEETKAADAADIDDVDDATLGSRIKSALGLGGGADDGGNSSEEPDADAEKAGRTLSQRNRRAVMAAIDAQLDLLNDAGVDHGMERFTDRADFAFDLTEYGDKGDYSDDEMDKDAPAGETADDDMTDENTDTDTEKGSDAPAWAESLAEKVESIEKRVDEMDEDAEAEKGLDDAPEWASDLAEKVDGLDERVDKVSKATADTQQTGGAEQTGGDELSEKEKAKRSIFLPNGGD